MVQTISEDMFDDILASGPKPFFFQKEEDGEVTIVFTSTIKITEPGEEDIAGRIWNPPVIDANGNPVLDFKGNPRLPWAKVEAEALINNVPSIYSMGGRESALLRAWIGQLRANEIRGDQLIGSKWSAMRQGKWNFIIRYIGRDESVSSLSQQPIKNESVEDIKSVLSELKTKNPMVTKGVDKKQLVKTVALLSGKSQEEVEGIWHKLIKDKVIVEINGKTLVV